MKPLISYLLTVYNKEQELPQTIQCLQNQSGLDGAQVEFIFVDDCSSDRSIEFLKIEAAKDSRIKIIENKQNRGPSVRINQAAKHASGSYLIPLDADDFLTSNGTRTLLNIAGDTGAALVFGKSKRGFQTQALVDVSSLVTVAKDPLAYCARKQIVHMGFLVDSQLWRTAGGADERIFIQDQSLPLSLSAAANRLAYIHDVVYWLRPQTRNNLSANTTQQHHDRFFSALFQLEKANISYPAKQYLTKQIFSSRWKLLRDTRKINSYFSEAFLSYICNKLSPNAEISNEKLQYYIKEMLSHNGVRRLSFS
ncbi:putative glycosyltransferase EpsH [Pseudovibrio sp. W64]|uniref:glycosyltransferase family 2 protein n=1 Tax=Pseudovibrio sp. W64 TaxID=1735583 RepID=UPI0007AEC396|nr:glycosyltransferase family 2 protein [Pseudovibrio sp. W64]KZK87935.1 putative glycosyltransferase EpsH [Pseudovibrio sp. W64]